MNPVLLTAALTGLFCAMFAGLVDIVTDALAMWQVMILGAVSGFCGSLFAQFALRRGK
jgi:hypothetical protein